MLGPTLAQCNIRVIMTVFFCLSNKYKNIAIVNLNNKNFIQNIQVNLFF